MTIIARQCALGWILVAALALPGAAGADQVIADDLIVQGESCIGLDCVMDEAFGSDTLRLKENNTRIRFDDTSSQPGVPNHDWELVANDSASGGRNRFSIQDDTAVTIPLTILGSAPTDSLFVDAGGRIGIGTSTPVATLDVAGGLTVSGTLTAGALNVPVAVSAHTAAMTGTVTAGSAAVGGNVTVGGNLVVAGILNGRNLAADGALRDALAATPSSTKGGVIPISGFSAPHRVATVTFETPYAAGDVYGVTFAVVTHGRRPPPRPYVIRQDATGFTVALGARRASAVTEVQWFARAGT